MSSLITKKSIGVCVAILGLWSFGNVQAQVVKGLNNATKTVTAPLKDTQKATKTAVEPIKDTRKAVQDISKAPKEVKKEIDNTERAFDQAGNEVKKAKSDVDKAADKLGGNRSAQADSTTKTPTGSGKTVIIDQRTGREAVRDGGGYGNLQSGGQSGAGAESASTEPNYDYRRVLLPPGKGKTNLKSASKANKAGSGSSSASASSAPAAPVKPDYSASPAREALESADFNMATLQDLFDYAVWDGPERDHTMRSIDYTLKQLKRDIDEIRYKDADRSVWNYEKSYRDWRDAYVQHGGQ